MTKRKAPKAAVTSESKGCMAWLRKYTRYTLILFGACCLISILMSVFAPDAAERAIPTVRILPSATPIPDTAIPIAATDTSSTVPTLTPDTSSTEAFRATIMVADSLASQTAIVRVQALSLNMPPQSTSIPSTTSDPLILTVEVMQTALELTLNAPTATRIPPTILPTVTRIVATPTASPIPNISRTGGTTMYAKTGDVRIRACPQGGAGGCEVIAVLSAGQAVTTYGTVEGSEYDNSTLWYETAYDLHLLL
jgi:hypothetical protein